MKNRSLDLPSIILVLVSAILLFGIVAGTIWAFASGNTHITKGSRLLFDHGVHNPAKETVIAADSKGKTAIFGDIGILRAITADKEPLTVIVSPFLPYPSEDIAFQEELVQKTRIMRTSILAWFRSRTLAEISTLGEAGVKKELLRIINSNLVLGQINIIYFDEYLVL